MHTPFKAEVDSAFPYSGEEYPFGETVNAVTLSTLKWLKEEVFSSFMVVIYFVKIFLILQEAQLHQGF